MVTGNLVESEIRQCLFEFKRRGTVPESIEDRIGNVLAEFRRVVSESPDVVKAMRKNQEPLPGEVPMHYDFYEEPCEPDRLERCEHKIRASIRNWYEGDIWQRIQKIPTKDWMLLLRPENSARNLNGWPLEGIKVYSPIDFYFKENGVFHILDWKSGTFGDHAEQMAVYALFAVKHLKQDVGNVTTQAVLLPKAAKFEPHWASVLEVECIEAVIKSQVEEERSILTEDKDAEGRPALLAQIDQFQAEPDTEKCKKCNFRITCSEGKAWLSRPEPSEAETITLPFGPDREEVAKVG